MKVLVVMDSMKGSISSQMANKLICLVGKEYGHEMKSLSVSDGGEGFLDSFLDMDRNYKEHIALIPNLYGERIKVTYLFSDSQKIAIVESALILGIQMISRKKTWRETTSAGIGAVINVILKRHHPKQIIIGLGGTGAVDGGFGCLTELGIKFYDTENKKLSAFAQDLKNIQRVVLPKLVENLPCKILVANDVTNVLFGSNGATMVYSNQKGVSEKDRKELDFAIKKMYYLLTDEDSMPGDGAAGGLGFALRFLGGETRSGFDIIAEEFRLVDMLSSSDLVITGEGRMDAQTLNGKLPQKISKIAKEFGIPCVAFVGAAPEDYKTYQKGGFQTIYPISKQPENLEHALKCVNDNLIFSAYSFFETLDLSQRTIFSNFN